MLPVPMDKIAALFEAFEFDEAAKLKLPPEVLGDLKIRKDDPALIWMIQNHQEASISKFEWPKRAFQQTYLNYNAFQLAAEIKNMDALRALTHRAKPLCRSYSTLREKSSLGLTCLQIACRNNWKEGVEYILKYNKEMANDYSYGLFPIHFAAYNQNEEIINVLIENGANPFAKDEEQKLPIDYLKDQEMKNRLHLKMLRFRLEQCNQFTEETWEFSQKNQDFVWEAIQKYKVPDFNQLICIKENNLLDDFFSKKLRENVTKEEYLAFQSKYPRIIVKTDYEEDMENRTGKKNAMCSMHAHGIHGKMNMGINHDFDANENEDMGLGNSLEENEIGINDGAENPNQDNAAHKEEEIFKPTSKIQMYMERCPILARLYVGGYQLLHLAARLQDEFIMDIFIKLRADLYAIDNKGRNILHHIAETGAFGVFNLIKTSFTCEAHDILYRLCNMEDNDHMNPLFVSIKHQDEDIFQAYYEYNQNICNSLQQNIAHIAAIYNVTSVLSMITNTKQGILGSRDSYQRTPIEYSIIHNHFEGFLLLLPFCINELPSIYTTIVKVGNEQFLQFLLSQDTKIPKIDNPFEMTLYHIAAYNKQAKIYDMLPKQKQSDQRDLLGNTAKSIMDSKPK